MSDGTSDAVELRFCDLCGMSIPQKEMDAGLARSVEGKVVGPCCLAKLVADLPATHVSRGGTAARPGAGLTLLLATSVILVAVLLAAWYVDLRSERRNPGAVLEQLGGRVDALARVLGDQQLVLRMQGETMGREATVRLEPALRDIQGEIAKLREAAGKSNVDLTPLQGRVSSLADQMGELAVRQGAVENELRRSLAALREQLAQLDGALRGLAAAKPAEGERREPPPEEKAPPERPELPAALAAKASQLASADPGQRWAAADEMIRSGDKRVVPYLLPLLADADPFVRRLCAEGLAQVGERVHCGALVGALEDSEAIVREAAYRSLLKLSGQRLPFDAEAADAARRGMVRRWQQWWEKEGEKPKG